MIVFTIIVCKKCQWDSMLLGSTDLWPSEWVGDHICQALDRKQHDLVTSSHQPHAVQSCAGGFWWGWLCPAEAGGPRSPWKPTPSPTFEDESQLPAKILNWGGGGGTAPQAPAKLQNHESHSASALTHVSPSFLTWLSSKAMISSANLQTFHFFFELFFKYSHHFQ